VGGWPVPFSPGWGDAAARHQVDRGGVSRGPEPRLRHIPAGVRYRDRRRSGMNSPGKPSVLFAYLLARCAARGCNRYVCRVRARRSP
jgi:hypothetical protein